MFFAYFKKLVTETPGTEPSDREELHTKPHNGEEDVPGEPNDSSENTQEQDREIEPFKIPEWIVTVVKFLLLASFIPLQAYARIYWKRTLWNRGRPNERTMIRWRQTCSLANLNDDIGVGTILDSENETYQTFVRRSKSAEKAVSGSFG